MNALPSIKKSLSLLLLAGVASCSGARGVNTIPAPVQPSIATPQHALMPHRSGILARIVGVGDSLTAGYQAGGFLGATNVRDPLEPSVIVRPGQENGWWADLDEMASGLPVAKAIDDMYDPATSPLPLIAGPGLNNQLVPAPPPAPFGLLKSGNACTAFKGFNAAGYLLSGLSTVRMNPRSRLVRDVAVPGITLHEANTIFEPQTNTCEPLPGVPGLLSLITDGESSTFWPVLGNYAYLGTNLTMVNAAASWHPTLATVWLGANDVLKYMGSGGQFIGGDNSVGQAKADVVQTVDRLKASGARVVVADLPNVLETPYFMRVTIPHNVAVCNFQTYAFCLLKGLGFPGALAKGLVQQIAVSYHLQTSGCVPTSTQRPCGYITLQGALAALGYYLVNSKLPDLDCHGKNYTAPCVPGSGIGTYYITPVFAAKIQLLNSAINLGIVDAAVSTSSPLVDIKTYFDGIAGGDPSNPYLQQAESINPGVCCTLAAEHGLVSFDGLHPSNTGYALVAYYFIQTINRAYGTHIPEINIKKVYNGTRCGNPAYCFADVYAPQIIGDAKLVRVGKSGLKIQYLRPR
ncbi:MAG TPA: hypothetical protein VNG31_09760 [Candidatus Baltobacteraceae bacterium]|nr:hypothetical protein [Candidatus Baltobacteraceae bacterium]